MSKQNGRYTNDYDDSALSKGGPAGLVGIPLNRVSLKKSNDKREQTAGT